MKITIGSRPDFVLKLDQQILSYRFIVEISERNQDFKRTVIVHRSLAMVAKDVSKLLSAAGTDTNLKDWSIEIVSKCLELKSPHHRKAANFIFKAPAELAESQTIEIMEEFENLIKMAINLSSR